MQNNVFKREEDLCYKKNCYLNLKIFDVSKYFKAKLSPQDT